MKQLLSRSLFAALLTVSAAVPAAAQQDVLLRLRSGSPPGDRFRVDSAGGVVALGSLGIGVIPASGSGERMMWYPFKAAFRAGGIGSGETQWDDANVGFYTWAGGFNSLASGLGSLAFGYENESTGAYSVTLGYTNTATGQGSVAIGYRSTADANFAVAIGSRASANGFSGAIVLSDASTTDSLEASANNQFSARAAGGYRLYTNSTETTGVSLNAGGSSWNVISDRNRKENFLAVDPDDVLARIRSLPVTTWQYTGEEDRTVRHIGPMAQDWHRAFGFSQDATTINMSDFDGVNLAAIQALDRANTAQDAEIRALREENAELRAQNEALEARLRRLEALAGTAP